MPELIEVKKATRGDMLMKRLLKHIIIAPAYIFCILEGFIGGVEITSKIWSDLVEWAEK